MIAKYLTGHQSLKIATMESTPHLEINASNANPDTDLIHKEDHVFKMCGTVLSTTGKISHNVHYVSQDMFWPIISVTDQLDFVKNTITSLIYAKNASPNTFYKTLNVYPLPV